MSEKDPKKEEPKNEEQDQEELKESKFQRFAGGVVLTVIVAFAVFLIISQYFAYKNEFDFAAESKRVRELKVNEERDRELSDSVACFGHFDGFVTIGDDVSDVLALCGEPDSISGRDYYYGADRMIFDENGKLWGYVNATGKLPVTVGFETGGNDSATLCVGMDAQDVIGLLGTPDTYLGNVWYYSDTVCEFDEDLVLSKIYTQQALL